MRDTVATIASKAKAPAMVGGAALAGLAGGIAVSRNGGKRKILGVEMPKLDGSATKAMGGAAKAFGAAAKEVGKAGYQVGQLTSEVRKVRERVED
jgi:hypothetical protein